jgi:hypothetical protein
MLISGLASAISGIYFLYLPVGGYQGGRNPYYGIRILFDRHVWDDIHTWASVVIIALVAVHIPLHWGWIIKMTRNGLKNIFGKGRLNKYSQFNLAINIMFGLSGLICGLSGLYFLLVPGASHISQLGDPGWIFNRITWDLVHTWSGVVMIAAGTLHFLIHWKWVVKVIRKYLKVLNGTLPQQHASQAIRVQATTADEI